MSSAGRFDVRVVYAERTRHIAISLRVSPGQTVGEIVRRCGILRQCPRGLDPLHGNGGIGIFGERVTPDKVPEAGDRIEIYRPLKRTPMEARRRRSAGPNRPAS